MITLLDSFLSQVEILLIGCLLYSLRLIISGDKRPILETLPDCVRNDLKNKYWLTFLGVLWFGFYTWLRYYLQFPRYGMWSSLFAYDNLLDILQSRRIIENVLLTELDTARLTHQTLADLYLDFTELKNSYDKKSRTAGINFKEYKSKKQLSLIQDSILYVIYKNLLRTNLVVDRTNKKTQIFKVQITSKSEYFSKLMTERIVGEAKNFYINIKVGSTQSNIDRLQQKADSLLGLLNGQSYESAERQVLNANPAMKKVGVLYKLAGRNETLLGALYTEIIKNLEAAKTSLMLQTPVIQILDAPMFPLENIKNRKLICIIIGGFLCSFIFLFFLTIKYIRQ